MHVQFVGVNRADFESILPFNRFIVHIFYFTLGVFTTCRIFSLKISGFGTSFPKKVDDACFNAACLVSQCFETARMGGLMLSSTKNVVYGLIAFFPSRLKYNFI